MNKIILVQAGYTAWEETLLEGCFQNAEQREKPTSTEGVSGPKNDQRRLQGTLSLPLSDAGKEALKEVAAMLQREGVSVIYSSGNESSGPTADCLADLCDLKTKKVTRMRELNCGLWQGLRIKDIKQRYSRAYRLWREDPTSVCPPDGETVIDAFERVQESIKLINKKNKNGTTIAIVAAPVVSAIIECILTGHPLEELWSISDNNEPVKKVILNDTLVNGAPQGRFVKFDTPQCQATTNSKIHP